MQRRESGALAREDGITDEIPTAARDEMPHAE
jgi:hypothetical protein